MEYLPGTAWLAVPSFQQNLLDELLIDPSYPVHTSATYGDLVYRENDGKEPPVTFWHRVVLIRPFTAHFESIGEAADILRGIQRNWAHYPVACFRRAELIREKLPHISEKPHPFPFEVPVSPMGIWSLLDEHTLLASAKTSSPFPLGEIRFEEDHVNPPSRAYLKMYEALTWVAYLEKLRFGTAESGIDTIPVFSVSPAAGTRCIDAGACPGGWTWVLNRLGSHVTAIDRSELDPRLMEKSDVEFIKHDAFTLKPEELGPADWVCSDVICYPPRLLEWIGKWLESGLCENFICTIKMQGRADHEITRAFAAIPGSHVLHLTANKNELTWIRIREHL